MLNYNAKVKYLGGESKTEHQSTPVIGGGGRALQNNSTANYRSSHWGCY